jgi:DNA mismatch repair protein MutL
LFDAGTILLVVDQHAAQERITFEMMIQQMENSRVEVQRLLSPYLVTLAPQELTSWEEAKDVLGEIGFESTLFDDQTIAVQTYPVLIKDVERAVRDILSGGDVARCDHESLARRACRASVMAGEKLGAKQAAFQREELIKCRDPFTCPHGRPTVVEMSESFLDKQFLRT